MADAKRENERITNMDLLIIASDPEVRKVYLEDVPRLIKEIRELWREKLQLEAERDDFFRWAEELASHGYNVTTQHGGNDEFYPVAKEYWNAMGNLRAAYRELGKELEERDV